LDRTDFDVALDGASLALDARRGRLQQLATARRVAVYSYGVRGTDLVNQLCGVGVDCVVFDNAPAARARAAADGRETADRLPPDLPVIVAAGQNQIEILDELGPSAHSLADALYAYDIRNSYGRARAFSDMTAGRRDELYARYLAIAPECRADFLDVLLYRASLDVRRLQTRLPVGQMWTPPAPLDIRSFCDVGAYDGDSLKAMKALYPRLERSFTVEPNPEMAGPIARVAAGLGVDNVNFAGAAWSRDTRLAFRPLFNDMVVVRESEAGELEARALDGLTEGATYDYVKFDVEAAEAPALEGARALLRRARCVAVAAYHLPDDLIDIPRQLEAILGGEGGEGGWRCRFRHYSQTFDDSIVYFTR
jgi:FkbM family methyltransferase